jgi:hypothetical protein
VNFVLWCPELCLFVILSFTLADFPRIGLKCCSLLNNREAIHDCA